MNSKGMCGLDDCLDSGKIKIINGRMVFPETPSPEKRNAHGVRVPRSSPLPTWSDYPSSPSSSSAIPPISPWNVSDDQSQDKAPVDVDLTIAPPWVPPVQPKKKGKGNKNEPVLRSMTVSGEPRNLVALGANATSSTPTHRSTFFAITSTSAPRLNVASSPRIVWCYPPFVTTAVQGHTTSRPPITSPPNLSVSRLRPVPLDLCVFLSGSGHLVHPVTKSISHQ